MGAASIGYHFQMKQTFLDFEKPIAEIEAQIEALMVAHDLAPDGTAAAIRLAKAATEAQALGSVRYFLPGRLAKESKGVCALPLGPTTATK